VVCQWTVSGSFANRRLRVLLDVRGVAQLATFRVAIQTPRGASRMTYLAANSDDRHVLPLTIPQAAQLLGISVSEAYEAAGAGAPPIIRIG
jgi:hypothetical protein